MRSVPLSATPSHVQKPRASESPGTLLQLRRGRCQGAATTSWVTDRDPAALDRLSRLVPQPSKKHDREQWLCCRWAHPLACRHVWFHGVCSWLVLVPLFSCCESSPPPTCHDSPPPRLLPLLSHSTRILLLLILLLLCLLRLLIPPFFSEYYAGSAVNDAVQHYSPLQVLVMWRTRDKTINQSSCDILSISCSSTHMLLKLLPIYASVSVSSPLLIIIFSSASLSGLPLARTSTFLGAISLLFHPVSFHAAVCCQVLLLLRLSSAFLRAST